MGDGDKQRSGKADGSGGRVRDIMLMVPVACIVGFAIYSTIQQLDRTGKAARWHPEANVSIISVEGQFQTPFNPSDRKTIQFTALDGRTISLDCYASRGVYSSSNLNTCLPMLYKDRSAANNRQYNVTYYTNRYAERGTYENIVLRVTEGKEVLFAQSIAESAVPR
jgi:hypothetical protein